MVIVVTLYKRQLFLTLKLTIHITGQQDNNQGPTISNFIFVAFRIMLTHCGLVTPYENIDLCQQWPRQWLVAWWHQAMGLLPDTKSYGLRMRRECRERFPRHRFQRKRLVSDPGIHHGTCDTHMPWCMLGSLTGGGGENVPGIPGACATRNFTYLARGPLPEEMLTCQPMRFCDIHQTSIL